MEEDLAAANASDLGARLQYVVYFSCLGRTDFQLNSILGSFLNSPFRQSGNVACDILFLVDTGYLEDPTWLGSKKNIEVIACAEEDERAPLVGFTPALIKVTRELARRGQPFSTVQLHEALGRADYGATPRHIFTESPIVLHPKGNDN